MIEREPGFYASRAEDRSFFVATTGEIFELVPDTGLRIELVEFLPDVESFGRSFPSMMFRVASFLGIDVPIPAEQTHLLIDEICWEGTLGVSTFEPELVTRLADAGLVLRRGRSAVFSDRGRDLLDMLSQALVARPFDFRPIAEMRSNDADRRPNDEGGERGISI